ncbi:hypothetical protein HZH66_001406 [Vespula vulgaris]|uniref:Uncharacterized protein n=1 Tax=Vespula vulgaris TaxID=7454 RepID=A0A834KUG7_VESVU|nr:hypothetical protein HZH66_001406 [Vespula vulgaris]
MFNGGLASSTHSTSPSSRLRDDDDDNDDDDDDDNDNDDELAATVVVFVLALVTVVVVLVLVMAMVVEVVAEVAVDTLLREQQRDRTEDERREDGAKGEALPSETLDEYSLMPLCRCPSVLLHSIAADIEPR